MTKRQAEVLKFIERFISDNGYSPTLAEMGLGLGINKYSVDRLLHHLEQDGRITRQFYRWRTVEVLRQFGAEIPAESPRQSQD